MKAILRFLDKYIRFEEPETIHTFRKEIDKITGKTNAMDILEEIVAEKRLRVVIRNLLTQTSYSVEQIAKLADVSLDFVKDVKKSIRRKK